MAGRKLNVQRWLNGYGETAVSYEEWRLFPVPEVPSARLFYALDSLNGVPAPKGFIWCKSLEIHPPEGDGWKAVK